LKKLLISVASIVAATGGVFGYLFHTGYFDDPAIKGCEAALIQTLKSPSSYERISAQMNENSAAILYDAQNAYGAIIRGGRECKFQFYNGIYEFIPEKTDNNEQQLAEAMFGLNLSAAVGHSLTATETKLSPREEHVLFDKCVRKTVSDTKSFFPLLTDLSWDLQENTTTKILTIRKRVGASPEEYPTYAMCQIVENGEVEILSTIEGFTKIIPTNEPEYAWFEKCVEKLTSGSKSPHPPSLGDLSWDWKPKSQTKTFTMRKRIGASPQQYPSYAICQINEKDEAKILATKN
jgi:hypothetical protein